ncbi:MAG: hypothetical protein IH840_01810 [Candidatus Heimdallarchaeota archaeon]|nr:hypothetical protein [Candidatus Heimdallarchaeota archaeon]
MDPDFLDAIYFYHGILEAYEIVGKELIGEDVLEKHAIPRMVYYVKNFLPREFKDKKEEELTGELAKFLSDLKTKINSQEKFNVSLLEVWQLRAAIFGYESAFLEILGDNVIKNYVLKRIPEILSLYLPQVFSAEDSTLKEKLQGFASYLKKQKFVKYANFSIKGGKVRFNVNHCAFAGIHDSDAYKQRKTRFCPWGMMVLAIVNAHEQKEFPIQSTTFATKGTITQLQIFD